MKMNNDSPILRSICAVNSKKDQLFKQADRNMEVFADLSVVSAFFNVDNKTAALLSVVICDQVMGESSSINKVMRNLGLEPIDFIQMNETITVLKQAGWLKTTNRGRYRANSNEYEIVSEVVDAVIYNNPFLLIIPLPDTLTDALLEIRRMFRELQEVFNKKMAMDELLSSVARFSQFPFIENLLSNNGLSEIEKYILLLFAAETLYGKEEFDLNETLDQLLGNNSESYYTVRRIKEGDYALLRDGYIKFVNPDLADFGAISLGDDLIGQIDRECRRVEVRNFASRYCQLIHPVEIQEQTLFFNPTNKVAVEEIMQFTSPVNFAGIGQSLTENGLRPGLTMLFYGAPGTGKTELVRQIAKKHQRPLLQVEIAAVKNMWVGESEKNLKRVFLEYKAALKHFENTPILFFNEADGILGERKQVNTAVDQMLNSMQNILLQELEDFQGIFIATTNLLDNIDGAFDRRMLYKLNFQNPDEAARFNILKNELPGLPVDLLKEISRKYTLSGGQIQNIRKKFLVDRILNAHPDDPSGHRLIRYVDEETNFRRASGCAIGFKNKAVSR